MKIRKMRPEDAHKIIQLDVESFKIYYPAKQPRSEQNILSSLALNPPGCFVALDNDLVGFVFSRKWGRLGWIGTFGVHPKHHSKGIGQELLSKAYEQLNRNCDIIGLETMPEAPYNVGMYLKMGFSLIAPTLLLAKTELNSTKKASLLSAASPRQISLISRKLLSGIDYGIEAENALQYRWGFPFANKNSFCILSAHSGAKDRFILVNALGSPTTQTNSFTSYLQSIENHALEQKATRIVLPVSSLHQNAIQVLLKTGYKVKKCSVRMLKKGNYGDFRAVDISRWAM
jgi:GNAT superfamily N-acetyltransferase